MIKRRTPPQKPSRPTNRGLTLTETLISLMVCGILLMMMQITHRAATGIEQVISGRMQTHNQMIQASTYILKDLRGAGSSSIIDVPADDSWHDDTISFYAATGASGSSITWDTNAITFSLSGTNLTRTYNSVSRIIATDISLFRLFRSSASPDLILVELESTKNTNYGGDVNTNFTYTAKLRN